MKYILMALLLVSTFSYGAVVDGKTAKIEVEKRNDSIEITRNNNQKSVDAGDDQSTPPDVNSCSNRCASSQCCTDITCGLLECLI